jgi:acetyltransferase-like isoleucine patch superfamily enzyme
MLIKFLFNSYSYIVRFLRLIYLKAQGSKLSWWSKVDFGCRFYGIKFLTTRGQVRIGPCSDIFLMKQNDSMISPILSIGGNSYIGRNFHVVATSPILIGENMLIANNVFISNCRHGIELTKHAFIDQALVDYGPITIGNNVWIGENSSIIGSLVIGNNVVIGNSENVTSDIPDNSIFKGGKFERREPFS